MSKTRSTNKPYLRSTANGKMTIRILDSVFEYAPFDSSIRDRDGSFIFKMDGVLFPPHWSQTAVDILSQKYLRRSGVAVAAVPVKETGIYPEFYRSEAKHPDTTRGQGETSAHEVFHRLAGCWTYWGNKRGYFANRAEALQFYHDCYYALYHQLAAPNSPQWFNTGLHWAYGITTKLKGTPAFYFDPDLDKVVRSEDSYIRPQPHACFIQSVEDTLVADYGIMDLFAREATVFKYGSGSGTNYSKLRGEGEGLSGGGKSSGMMSFLRIGDAGAGAIKSGGTTRRAARLVVVDADHPDIIAYTRWKVIEENKVASLAVGSKITQMATDGITAATSPEELDAAINYALTMDLPTSLVDRAVLAQEQGFHLSLEAYGVDWESEAYRTVNGQNANNSVSITDEFMRRVDAGLPWDLIARTDGSVTATLAADELWDEFARAAWASADPALIYYDTVNRMNTCANDEAIRAANPCVEYHWFDDTACNLASLNITGIWLHSTQQVGAFINLIKTLSRLWAKVLDISIEMAQFPSDKIALKTWQYRTLGLGYANIGSMIMRLGHSYGDANSQMLVEGITGLMGANANLESIALSYQLGAFPRYADNVQPYLRVMNIHRGYAADNLLSVEGSYASDLIRELAVANDECWDTVVSEGAKNGWRNAQVTVIAPTGTISFAMDCDTTGIEPDFSLVKHKKLAGGGYLKIANASVVPALENLGYSNSVEQIQRWVFGARRFPTAAELRELGLDVLQYVTRDDLVAAGVPSETLDALPDGISNYYDVASLWAGVVEPYTRDNPLKASAEVMATTSLWIYGTGSMEGCPFIKPEHESVFYCSVPSGNGVESISADSHMRVMAAAQKYISGGISKTINLPATATVEDIKSVYREAHRMGIKAVSVYRDGSKLSQPLMSSVARKLRVIAEVIAPDEPLPTVTETVKLVEEAVYRAKRRPLPDKRKGYTQKANVAGHKIYTRTGEYKDGTLGELFIDVHKEGATLRALLNNFAISVSLGLQFGVPLDRYVEAFTFTKFEPAGVVRNHSRIKMAESILDYIFRDLAINYLDRNDLANTDAPEDDEPAPLRGATKSAATVDDHTFVVPAGKTVSVAVVGAGGVVEKHANNVSAHQHDDDADRKTAMASGYTGNQCGSCQSFKMKRTGTCMTCENCGNTSGCA